MGSLSAEEYFYKVDNMVLCSCQLLRKLFHSRWKENTGNDWENTEKQGKDFLKREEGKKVYKICSKLQKELIEKGCLDEWDMSTISLVLQTFGDQKLHAKENGAVKQLTKLRNELAHHPTKKLSREDYNNKVESFRETLQALQIADESEIENIVKKAGISSALVALEAMKELLEKGEKHLSHEQFGRATACYDEAVTMPSLLPVDEGSAYEQRADCYIKQANYLKQKQMRSDSDACVEQALLDSTRALKLNENSWKAEFLIGRCHRWNGSYKQAIQHCSRALALSPVQKHVKSELDSCKILAGCQERHEITNPINAPVSLSEMIATFEKETGAKLTEEQYIQFVEERCKEMRIKGQLHVFKGEQFLNGWLVKQNEEEAAHYFAKAAKVGNAEGIYRLGLCYEKGKGVPQDLQKTYELFLQAANMSPNLPGIRSGGLKNSGVVSAQHALGLMFHTGVYVNQDYIEAARWYENAARNGCGSAAHNLGLMHHEGHSFPRNEKQAAMYWKKAVKLKCSNSAKSLMNYYIRNEELEKARAMFQTGKELGNEVLLRISEEEFNNLVEAQAPSIFAEQWFGKGNMEILKAGVTAYERKHNLDPKGMSFSARLRRKMIGNDSKMERVYKNFEELESNDRWGGQLKSMDFEKLERIACQGSNTAQKVLEAIYNALKLATLVDENECETDAGNDEALDLLYKCCTSEFHVASLLLYSHPYKGKLINLIGKLFSSKCGEKGEEDMKIRYCYVCLNALLADNSKNILMMEILKKGVQMYPDNVHFYQFLTDLCGLYGDSQSGLEWAEKGLQKFPIHVNLLYSKAAHLRMLPEPTHWKIGSKGWTMHLGKMVAAYKDFLSKAPPDHRHVPEAYYAISRIHIEETISNKDRDTVLKKVEHFLNMGKEAENKMLPCYLPYGESDVRRNVENFLVILAKANDKFSSESRNQTTSQPTPIQIFKRKQYLAEPVRKRLIVNHRQKQKDLVTESKKFKNRTVIHTQTTGIPKLRKKLPENYLA